MTTYKITYEHSSNGETQTEDTLPEYDNVPTKIEINQKRR
ncbi:hypothetical protein ABIE05_003982 [Kosakonia cowanii]|jgi:hypothetical protein